MKIPELFFGSYRDVKRRCEKIVRGLSDENSWHDYFDSEKKIDTQTTDGLIILAGPAAVLDKSASNFHCYVFLDTVRQFSYKSKVSSLLEEEIFKQSLKSAWGTLGLLSYKNVVWFWHPENTFTVQEWEARRYLPLLAASLEHWDTLYAEGNRYTNGAGTPKDLWSISTNIKYVLANMGVSSDILNASLPSGGLKEVVEMAVRSSLE
jgi:hypothetical protein